MRGQGTFIDFVRILSRGAVFEFEIGQTPTLRAVFERVDWIRHAEVDERLRAKYRTGAAGAIHNDFRIRVADDARYAVRQLGVGAAGAAGNGHLVVLTQWSPIEQHEILARLFHGQNVLSREAWRVVHVLDEFPKELARDVDAREQRVPCVAPSARAAVEHGDVSVTGLPQASGCNVRDTAFAAIAQHHACRSTRDERRDVQFQPAIGKGCCEE